ncbi:hypothetical protein KL864_27105 [Mycolicibacterium goodii]|uniref:hypothetical protein n=1 Tax=Mycolicibacterium goodii TaxID=134601 RepID=UPI001BDC8FF6|nr:hypothetical protein [Mycolicibacterium goodii]MBU8819559.1 hypothetical protein [Mycolicibacterium goodii]
MSDLTPSDWLDQPVRITRDGVFFGDHQLPGVIAENGVTLQTGIDGTDINKLTVGFLVGEVHVDDPAVYEQHVTHVHTATQYGVKRPSEESTDV